MLLCGLGSLPSSENVPVEERLETVVLSRKGRQRRGKGGGSFIQHVSARGIKKTVERREIQVPFLGAKCTTLQSCFKG